MNDTARINGEGKKVFKYEPISNWVQVEFKRLKKGDKFRIYNRNGKPILINGQEIYVAFSDACNADGRWTVEVLITNLALKTEIHTPKWFLNKQD